MLMKLLKTLFHRETGLTRESLTCPVDVRPINSMVKIYWIRHILFCMQTHTHAYPVKKIKGRMNNFPVT